MSKSSAPKTVTLIDRDGNDYKATNAAEVNSLVFGGGYRVKDQKLTVDEAIESLTAVDQASSPQTVVTKTA